MSAKDQSVILSKFIAITECPPDQARQYLIAADWNEQTAMDLFFDGAGPPANQPPPSTATRPPAPKVNKTVPGKVPSNKTDPYESDDDLLQTALEESLHVKPPEKPPVTIPKRTNDNKSIVSSAVNTVDKFRRNEESSDEEGQAFYVGGSERSGQQVIGPPKSKSNDKKVSGIFDAARKQGATEDNDDEHASSSQTKKEKPFTGVGRALGDNTNSSRPQDQPSSGATAAAASNQPEQLPIRFYSNGFTVGDGELRKLEDNKEFMDYIKRGEVPPELRNSKANGRQVQISLEDHRGEEYKRVAPSFKPFGGTGNTVGLPASNIPTGQASSVSTASASVDATRLEQLASKRLKTTSSSTTIRLRLPDVSTPVSIQIDLNRTLADVRKFLNENVPSLQSNTFEFMEPPSTKIKREDEKRKISDAKLSNSTLAVRRTG